MEKKEISLIDIKLFRVYVRIDGHTVVTINNKKYTSNNLQKSDMIELVDTLRELLDIEVEFPQDPRKKDEFD